LDRLHGIRKESIMLLNHMLPLEESVSTPYICAGALNAPTFDLGPTEFDGAPSDPGDGGQFGWAGAWIDLGGEG
jgi:hypothetical protein